MKELIISNLSEIIITGLVAVVSYVLTTIGNAINKKLEDERIKTFIEDTVKYINQAHGTLTNEEKFNLAVSEIKEYLTTEGLKITESKLRVLIESAVGKFK